MNDLKKAWTEMEVAGYAFEIRKEPITEPASDYNHYFVVEVLYDGAPIGTRSEVEREEAMMRAIKLARLHREDPAQVSDQTLAEYP